VTYWSLVSRLVLTSSCSVCLCFQGPCLELCVSLLSLARHPLQRRREGRGTGTWVLWGMEVARRLAHTHAPQVGTAQHNQKEGLWGHSLTWKIHLYRRLERTGLPMMCLVLRLEWWCGCQVLRLLVLLCEGGREGDMSGVALKLAGMQHWINLAQVHTQLIYSHTRDCDALSYT
jgi:hypothetical protein